MNDWGKHRLYLMLTVVLSVAFLVNKYFEYADHLSRGEGPWHSTFLAIYFTLTGLHGLHILGGIIGMAYFLGPGAKRDNNNPEQVTNRIRATSRSRTASSTPGCTGASWTWYGSSSFRFCTCCRSGCWRHGRLR